MTDSLNPVYIIAEAGVNHNGDPDRAMEMIEAAAEAGADAVKFQTFKPDALASRLATQADYQVRNEGGSQNMPGSQLAMLKILSLSFDDHYKLQDKCRECNIEFLSSPFDPESARFLIEEINLPRLKLGSGELTNGPLLLQLALADRPLILSTGMATPEEIREALGVVAFGLLKEGVNPSRAAFTTALENPQAQVLLQERITLLHCTTEYPCPPDQVNLRAMDTLKEVFGLPTGYSDHTLGIHVSLAAAAKGARVIEKHFTLDRELPGPDHPASLEPVELKNMVEGIREISQALGSAEKRPAPEEIKNIEKARKSIIAMQEIKSGDIFSSGNITIKRPGSGRSPMEYWEILGQTATQDYDADEVIS